jgi:hypothetical protein
MFILIILMQLHIDVNSGTRIVCNVNNIVICLPRLLIFLLFFVCFSTLMKELCMANVTSQYDQNQLNCSCPDACRYVYN